jgi:hypothetical protein
MSAKGVVDLTFNDLANDADIEKCIADKSIHEEQIKGAPISPAKTQRRHAETKAIRLGNNNIGSLDIVAKGIATAATPVNVEWLDLSFNSIEKITPAFAANFPNLHLLYLQANQIQKLSELKKLQNFKNLKSLTLFGNPVEESKHYRNMVLYALPNLQILDFCPITKEQRSRNEVWATTFRRILNPEIDYD